MPSNYFCSNLLCSSLSQIFFNLSCPWDDVMISIQGRGQRHTILQSLNCSSKSPFHSIVDSMSWEGLDASSHPTFCSAWEFTEPYPQQESVRDSSVQFFQVTSHILLVSKVFLLSPKLAENMIAIVKKK